MADTMTETDEVTEQDVDDTSGGLATDVTDESVGDDPGGEFYDTADAGQEADLPPAEPVHGSDEWAVKAVKDSGQDWITVFDGFNASLRQSAAHTAEAVDQDEEDEDRPMTLREFKDWQAGQTVATQEQTITDLIKSAGITDNIIGGTIRAGVNGMLDNPQNHLSPEQAFKIIADRFSIGKTSAASLAQTRATVLGASRTATATSKAPRRSTPSHTPPPNVSVSDPKFREWAENARKGGMGLIG